MAKSLFIYVFLLLSAPCIAQKNYTISGTITDKATGETLIGAVVAVEGKSVGTTTNEYGFYSISLQEGDYNIRIQYVGYSTENKPIALNAPYKLNVALSNSGSLLKEVVVHSKPKNDNITSAQMGMEKLNVKELSVIPVLFGEKDIIKVVQLLPGVKTSGDAGGLFVRGGAADQNLMLLDEAIVYNPSHLLGFFSVFNSDAIKNLTLYKGSQPAQYGGRLSSVMDIKMNDGNDQTYHANGGIGLISSRLTVEGPIVKDKGSFLVSGRRTYADLFLGLANDPALKDTKLHFYDLNGKLNYKLTDKDRVYLSGYFGKDVLAFGNNFGMDWGNSTATFRWNHLFSPKVFSNTSLIYSNYNYNIHISNTGIEGNLISTIKDLNLKEEINYYANNNHSLSFGLNAIYHTISPGIFTTQSTAPHENDTHSLENALYATDKWRVSEKLNVDIGVRASMFFVLGGTNKYYSLDESHQIINALSYAPGEIVKTYVNPEPRLSASYQMNESSSLKAAYARNAQYLHLLSNSTTSNPTDKWVATNNVIKPETADQVSLGYFKNLKDNAYELSAEVYYKSMQNKVDYKDNAQIVGSNPVEPELLFGTGRAYGIELMARKNVGNLTGWVSYTLSRTELKIDGINNFNWYPGSQDKTHDLSVVAVYKLSKKWTVSADFIYNTGKAVSFPSGKYEVDNNVVFYYTERNGYRQPAYHRLDIGATLKLKEHKHYSSELAFSIYNVYGRQNPYTINFQTDPDNFQRTQAVQTSLFRWIPSIAYNFKF